MNIYQLLRSSSDLNNSTHEMYSVSFKFHIVTSINKYHQI